MDSSALLLRDLSRDIVVERTVIAALAFLIYEFFLTLGDEVQHIWSKPNKSWLKWAFFLTRYAPLAAVIAHRLVITAVQLGLPASPNSLKIFFVLHSLTSHYIMLTIQILLMSRVYALYDQKPYILFSFLAILVTEIILMVVGLSIGLPSGVLNLRTLINNPPSSMAYFGLSSAVSQLVILALTLTRCWFYFNTVWKKTPLLVLLVRDGTVTFLILFVLAVLIVVFTLQSSMFASLVQFWYLVVMSSVGCRMITNFEVLDISDHEEQLTTAPFHHYKQDGHFDLQTFSFSSEDSYDFGRPMGDV
jgi:hypothetical protein